MSQDMIARFGADDRGFRRTLRDMERTSERSFSRIGSVGERSLMGIATRAITAGAALRGLSMITGRYAKEFDFAERSMRSFRSSMDPLVLGVGRDLHGWLDGAGDRLRAIAIRAADARDRVVDLVSDWNESIKSGTDMSGNSASIRRSQQLTEIQDRQNRSLAFIGPMLRGLEAGALERANPGSVHAQELRLRAQLADSMRGLQKAFDQGRITVEDRGRLERALNADLDDQLNRARINRAREQLGESITRSEGYKAFAQGTVRPIFEDIGQRRADQLRRGGDEFGARQLEIRSRYGSEIAALEGVGGPLGAIQREGAAARRDGALADLEQERALRREMLDDEIRRGDIARMRAQGDREGAERAAIELDYRQRIRDVERDGMLSREDRQRAIDAFTAQRDAALGQVSADRSPGRTVQTGLNAAVARVALGTGVSSDKLLGQGVNQLASIDGRLATLVDQSRAGGMVA